MEEGNDLLQELEQATPAHKVKILGKIDECDVEWHLLFTAFLLQLSNGENHIDRGTLRPKATLRLGKIAAGKDLQTRQYYTGKNLAYDNQQRYAPVVVTNTGVALAFVQRDDLGSWSWYLPFAPAKAQEFMKWLQEG